MVPKGCPKGHQNDVGENGDIGPFWTPAMADGNGELYDDDKELDPKMVEEGRHEEVE